MNITSYSSLDPYPTMPKFLQRFVSIIRNISVEPVVILNYLALHMMLVSINVGLIRVICEKKFKSENVKMDCWGSKYGFLPNTTNITDWNRVEIEFQESAATLTMIFALAYMIPCIFVDIFMGAYSDEHGRKYNILIGITGSAMLQISWSILLAWPSIVPIYIVAIGNFLSGVTGHLAIVMISAAAYMADSIVDSSTLTLRMTILALSYRISEILGPMLAKAFLGITGFAETVVIAIAITGMGFVYAMIMLKQIPPKQMRNLAESKINGLELKIRNHNSDATSAGFKNTLLASLNLAKSAWMTFSKNRPGHRRSYLIILCVAFLLCLIGDNLSSGTIMALFLQKSPFRWNQNGIAEFKSMASLMSLVGSTIGIFVFKKRLHFCDTQIVVIGLTSLIIKFFIFAFSEQKWMLFLAAATGLFGPLVTPCVQSFVAQIVEPDEVGKAYAGFSIAGNLALFGTNMIMAAVYKATVSWFGGFVFLLFGILVIGILGFSIWVCIDYNDYRFFRRDQQRIPAQEQEICIDQKPIPSE